MSLSKTTLNVTDAVQTLLGLLSIKITRTAIINEINQHPYKKILLGISDLLNNWNILNTARQIDQEELKTIPGHFIAYLISNNGEFVVIDQISDSGITIINKRGNTKNFLFDSFISEWNGIVLTAEKLLYRVRPTIRSVGTTLVQFIVETLAATVIPAREGKRDGMFDSQQITFLARLLTQVYY